MRNVTQAVINPVNERGSQVPALKTRSSYPGSDQQRRSHKTDDGNAVWQCLQYREATGESSKAIGNRQSGKAKPKAQGEDIMHLGLTGSSLWNC